MNSIIILSITLFLGAVLSSMSIKIVLLVKENKSLKNELKKMKNVCCVVGNDIYSTANRMTTGNVSHAKGNIQNMANLVKQIGEN